MTIFEKKFQTQPPPRGGGGGGDIRDRYFTSP